MTPRSRGRICPRFARNFLTPDQKAQGTPGARCTRGLVCKNAQKNAHEHTGSAEAIRHSLRNGLRLIRALPGDRAFLPPSPALLSANLTPASGRQDHTTSPSASAPFVKSASASTASRPASVTLRNAPLGQDGYSYSLILTSEKPNFFAKRAGHRTIRERADLPVGHSISLSGSRSQDELSPSQNPSPSSRT
ncbi:MAG: hypothetical protein QOJ15_9581 [Bradyrhizobium sp.]|jgi:hypothetical protein|nr:hypothetical protein [Bradyrhizobium sp.]